MTLLTQIEQYFYGKDDVDWTLNSAHASLEMFWV